MKTKKEIPAAGFCIVRTDYFKGNQIVYLFNRRIKYPFGILYRWLNDDDGFQIFFKGKWRDEESINFEFPSDEKEIIKYVFAGCDMINTQKLADTFSDEELKLLLSQCGYKTEYTRSEIITMITYLVFTHKYNMIGLKHPLLKKK